MTIALFGPGIPGRPGGTGPGQRARSPEWVRQWMPAGADSVAVMNEGRFDG